MSKTSVSLSTSPFSFCSGILCKSTSSGIAASLVVVIEDAGVVPLEPLLWVGELAVLVLEVAGVFVAADMNVGFGQLIKVWAQCRFNSHLCAEVILCGVLQR